MWMIYEARIAICAQLELEGLTWDRHGERYEVRDGMCSSYELQTENKIQSSNLTVECWPAQNINDSKSAMP
jgi:hypothetical protein